MTGDHVDVVIVGAGLSGVGAACHLQLRCPGKSFVILEARDAIGGTWDLFRYPGVRSDSDMYTLGYVFRPWTAAKAIADGPAILEYVGETAREYGVDQHIWFGHRVIRARWSSEAAQWTVLSRRTDTGEMASVRCSFLFVCSGYYRYDEGYTPQLPGIDRFQGRIVHPQRWPDDLDYSGKRVIVIGSGATAVTLVPAMAREAAHVTMLQRSPSYVLSVPSADKIARLLRRALPQKPAYSLVRWRNILLAVLLFKLSRSRPELTKTLLRKAVASQLPSGYDVGTHFTPRYNPWDQRLCLLPDADLLQAIKNDRASIVTDHVRTVTDKGIELESGEELQADIVVTATGLQLLALGGITLTVDGTEVDLSQTVTYKGMMLAGVPNCAMTIGYTNASWTLKADLVAQYVCRLIRHMDRRRYATCTPIAPEAGELLPLIDFTSGYVRRSVDALPKQGSTPPWRLYQSYPRDLILMRFGRLEDKGMRFARPVTKVSSLGRARK
jgi:cation diffusion facilitator CzcD-associated flavoprotein CzcO